MSLLSRATPAGAWVGTQSESANGASFTPSVTPAPLKRAPTPGEVGLQLRSWSRALPQDPNPVALQIPPNLTAEELRGGYGFALALSIFSGLLLTATLVLLFGLWARQRWFEAPPSPRHRPSTRHRSSPSHR